MDIQEVYSNLCYKDTRNPLYYHDPDEEPEKPRDNCYCDNCFYGRDELAVYILRLIDILDMLEEV